MKRTVQMIRKYVIFSVTMENVKILLKMEPKTRPLYFTISQCYNKRKLKTYIPKERRRIEEAKYRGKETLQT